MPIRRLPLQPDLAQLKRQAKELSRAARANDATAVALLREHHPGSIDPSNAKLADAHVALARSYGFRTWSRLALACRVANAIWHDDDVALRDLIRQHPALLGEEVRGPNSHWGPPLSYAANLGRERSIEVLHELGARDVQHAFDRAILQGQLSSAQQLLAFGASVMPGSVIGPCDTLNAAGLAFLIDRGAPLCGAEGDTRAPIAMLLQTSNRNPQGKHDCFELVVRRGVVLPDTPPMALHRGRIDLLEEHLHRDRDLFSRTFSHADWFPRDLGCSEDESLALHGTPLGGATLLHAAVDYGETETARWMLERLARADVPARVDAGGFGGHTALFGSVVSQAYLCGLDRDGTFATLLLDAGANPNARASLRKRMRFVADTSMHEYRDVTPLGWGERFTEREWVNRRSVEAIVAAGGTS